MGEAGSVFFDGCRLSHHGAPRAPPSRGLPTAHPFQTRMKPTLTVSGVQLNPAETCSEEFLLLVMDEAHHMFGSQTGWRSKSCFRRSRPNKSCWHVAMPVRSQHVCHLLKPFSSFVPTKKCAMCSKDKRKDTMMLHNSESWIRHNNLGLSGVVFSRCEVHKQKV